MTIGRPKMLFIAAALFLTFAFTSTSSPPLRSVPRNSWNSTDGYKSALDLEKALFQMNDAEFRDYVIIKTTCKKIFGLLPQFLKNLLTKISAPEFVMNTFLAMRNKKILEKKRVMEAKSSKLNLPAKAFIAEIHQYAAKEIDNQGSQIEKYLICISKQKIVPCTCRSSIERSFYKFRSDWDACQNLLEVFPELKKLGKC